MNRLSVETEARAHVRRLAPRVVLLAVLALAPAAQAAELTPAQKQEMKQLYERATRAYDVGKYNEAIEEYQKAYEIGGDPPMLYNIAQAYRLNDQPNEALRFYRRYLQRAPNARNREDVERKIADLEKAVEERRKAAAAATPPPVTAPPIVPAPTTTAPPPAPLAGPPAPVAPAPPSTTETPATPPAPIPVEGGSGHGLRVVGWSLVGVGVLSGAGAVVTGLLARGKGNDLTNMSAAGKTFDPTIEHSGKLYNNLTWGLGIAGGALAATGAILVIVGSMSDGGSSSETPPAADSTPPPAPTAMVTPWLGNGLVGAGAGFRF
jgi:tetratricopeptide (TPR) repeat protein